MFFSLQNEGSNFQRQGTLWTFVCLQHCMSYTSCLQLRIDLFLLPILPPPPNLKTCFIPLTKSWRQFIFLGAYSSWLGWTFHEIPFHPIPRAVHLQTKHTFPGDKKNSVIWAPYFAHLRQNSSPYISKKIKNWHHISHVLEMSVSMLFKYKPNVT